VIVIDCVKYMQFAMTLKA